MLNIHAAQIKTFEQAALLNFENEVVDHIHQFAATQFQSIGDRAVREVVRTGMSRAMNYGLTNRGPVRFYVETTFMLGTDFDTDPQYPWAERILNDPEPVDQSIRADRLYDQAMAYVQAVTGPDNCYEREALRRIIPLQFEDLPTEEGIAEAIRRLYPQKCEFLGEAALDALIDRGKEMATKSAAYSSTAIALFTGLMFIFGHGCLTDPQYPWISDTLRRTSSIDSNERLKKLYSKTMTYLNHAFERMERR